MNELPIVPDSEIEFDSDLVFMVGGKPFTGIGFDEKPHVGRCEITYMQNVLHGPTREYDDDGRLILEAWYEYGFLLEERRFDAGGAVVETKQMDPRSEEARRLEEDRQQYGWPPPRSFG